MAQVIIHLRNHSAQIRVVIILAAVTAIVSSVAIFSVSADPTEAGEIPVPQQTPTAVAPNPQVAPLQSTWTGNGSIISHHARHLTTPAAQGINWPFGATLDVTKAHATLPGLPAGFFQWQVNSPDCERLELYTTDAAAAANLVDITFGTWSSREDDIAFNDVTLPFVLGSSNTQTLNDASWWVIAVEFKNLVNTDLYAKCTMLNPTPATPVSAGNLVLVGSHLWNGNGSVLSNRFSSQSGVATGDVGWPFGAFFDISKVRPSPFYWKPAVFFQWQVWDSGCQALTIDAPDLIPSERRADIRVKDWSSPSSAKVFFDKSLPFEINSANTGLTMSDGRWLVVNVEFIKAVTSVSDVWAKCPGF